MLSPEQLKALPDSIVKLFEDLEDYIIADIARRLGKIGDMTDTAKIQLEIANAIGVSLPRIKKEIQKATEKAMAEVDRLFEEETLKSLAFENEIYKKAGYNPIDLAKSPTLMAILTEGMAQTRGDLKNLTQSLGFAYNTTDGVKFKPIATFYQESLNQALLKVRTGATDYQAATRQAINRMAERGLVFVDYKTSHVNRLDVATRRAVITGANQMNMRMTEGIMDELGAEYVEVTAHIGARPSHADWQGQVYHVGGPKDGYDDFVETTGYGSGAGLGGWNCRHSFFPFFPGISSRTWTDDQLENMDPPPFVFGGKTYTYYEATQIQRAMETDIRRIKRQIVGNKASSDTKAFQNASIKLNRKKQQYRDFSNAANLRYQFERTQVRGFSRSPAQRVRQANSRYLKALASEKSEDIIKQQPKMNKEVIDRVNTQLKRKGWIIHQSAEADGYLIKTGKEAVTYSDGLIIMHTKVSPSGFYEELIHYGQIIKGKSIENYPENNLLLEIEAKKKLIKFRKAYGISDIEIAVLTKYLDAYILELKKLRGGK